MGAGEGPATELGTGQGQRGHRIFIFPDWPRIFALGRNTNTQRPGFTADRLGADLGLFDDLRSRKALAHERATALWSGAGPRGSLAASGP